MTRLRMDLAYDGTDFSGWARQPGLRTVQGAVEDALARALRLAEAPAITCAGRTDAGVHAIGQVAHVDVEVPGDADLAGLARSIRGLLPPDAWLRDLTYAPAGFDARFSALWRRYVYRLCDDPTSWDPLMRRQVVLYPRPLDVGRLTEAAGALVGEHDFAALCKPREGASTVRRVLALDWRRSPTGLAEMTVVADAFCHSMVRAMVGALVPVGDGRQAVGWPGEVLAARVREPRVTVMPPQGLVLEAVGYPADEELEERQRVTRAFRGES